METKRVLREDYKTRQIIKALVPDLEAFKKEQDKKIAREALESIAKNSKRIQEQWAKLGKKRERDEERGGKKIKVFISSGTVPAVRQTMRKAVLE